jgi:hypothetical protein
MSSLWEPESNEHPPLDDVRLRPDPLEMPPISAGPPDTGTNPETPQNPARRRRWWWLGLAVTLLVLALAGAYVLLRQNVRPERVLPPPPVETADGSGEASSEEPGEPSPPVDLPPLNDSDEAVREAASRLAEGAGFAPWLQADDLLRRFTAAVVNVAEGVNPKVHLPFPAPQGEFRVVGRGGRLFIDPESYRRYDGLAAVAARLDAVEAARLLALFTPLMEEAYRELGYPEGRVRTRLTQAVEELLAVPVLEGDGSVEVVEGVLSYTYRDPALEGLTAAQKQLLRTGPRNVRILQESLRRVARELELPLN